LDIPQQLASLVPIADIDLGVHMLSMPELISAPIAASAR
jgi:hypothetical protein